MRRGGGLRPFRAAPATTTCHIYPSCLVFSPLSLSHPTTSFFCQTALHAISASAKSTSLSRVTNFVTNKMLAYGRPERGMIVSDFLKRSSQIFKVKAELQPARPINQGRNLSGPPLRARSGSYFPPPSPWSCEGPFFVKWRNCPKSLSPRQSLYNVA